MFAPKPSTDQVDCLLRNAELRDQLDPLIDESIEVVDVGRMSTRHENDFLESMLEWERAPMMPIGEWFSPPLELPDAEGLSDAEVTGYLAETVDRLYSVKVVLDFTDHLTDRQLYTLIARDILPSYEKKLDRRSTYLHWDCANTGDDPEAWLRYYASVEDRQMWSDETGLEPPPRVQPTNRRRLPRAPM